VISSLLANTCLHYALDFWTERRRKREAAGDMIIVCFAAYIIVGFELDTCARRFLDEMCERLGKFVLSLRLAECLTAQPPAPIRFRSARSAPRPAANACIPDAK